MGLFGSLFGAKQAISSTKDVESRLNTENKTENIEKAAEGGHSQQTGEPGQFRLGDTYKIMGVGCIPTGEVLSGPIRAGDMCEYGGKTYTIKTLEMRHQQLSEAQTGDKIGMSLPEMKDPAEIPKGTVLSFHQ